MTKVFAAHQTAPLWYTHPPNDESYYVRTVDESELVDGVYINIKMELSPELKKAVEIELRKNCREEAVGILELADEKDREDFLKYHKEDKGNLCCLVLDFAKKKLVEEGKMKQKEGDCFEDPYKWLEENGDKKG
jgi:hypothetical protein